MELIVMGGVWALVVLCILMAGLNIYLSYLVISLAKTAIQMLHDIRGLRELYAANAQDRMHAAAGTK